ncbi:MAG TPA: four helix bundle protein [Candidatus Tripitaka californicus]|uniref:four helix bundle protein n=1 Tax=Candidatus Tripitaka californicus TaxID=3367616 RepID=UPI004026D46F|nr:four helix bundle protein [Planctomycetota bacterium]
MKRVQRFEDLEVWQKAHRLVLEIYKVTTNFPVEERFGLISQMRRTAVSVPANIAEGYKKRSLRDKANFYNIAQGSLEELRYYLILSGDLGYLKNNYELLGSTDEVGRMLYGLATSVSK